jgi:hypothetical protein
MEQRPDDTTPMTVIEFDTKLAEWQEKSLKPMLSEMITSAVQEGLNIDKRIRWLEAALLKIRVPFTRFFVSLVVVIGMIAALTWLLFLITGHNPFKSNDKDLQTHVLIK